jgi:hypothetical protein
VVSFSLYAFAPAFAVEFLESMTLCPIQDAAADDDNDDDDDSAQAAV